MKAIAGIGIGRIAIHNGAWRWVHGQCGAYVVYAVHDLVRAEQYRNPARGNLTATTQLWVGAKVDFGTLARPHAEHERAKRIAIRYCMRYAVGLSGMMFTE